MKLSELNTERAADVLCEVSIFLANILNDENLRNSLRPMEAGADGKTATEKAAFGVERISQWIPRLLREHRDDMFGILAAINDVSADEIKKQNLIKTMRQIKELATDKEFMDFFGWCASEANA